MSWSATDPVQTLALPWPAVGPRARPAQGKEKGRLDRRLGECRAIACSELLAGLDRNGGSEHHNKERRSRNPGAWEGTGLGRRRRLRSVPDTFQEGPRAGLVGGVLAVRLRTHRAQLCDAGADCPF